MAFCKNCGTNMGGALFCPGCGASADGVDSAPVMDVRQRSLHDMDNMRAYFGLKAAQYEEFAEVSKEVEVLRNKSFGGYIVAAIVFALIGLIGGVFFWIGAAACVIAIFPAKKKNNKKVAIASARQAELQEELETYYNDYGYCPVGFEYTSPGVLASLHDIIRKGRATNPGDAINLLLNDLRDEEMRRLQEEATAAAKETAENSKKAAKSAKKAAGYAGASFWFK